MIIGAHSIIRSTNPEADCAFLRDVLKLTHVDDGGYLIFGLPPAEVSVHASDKNDGHQLYLMCDNVKAFVAEMEQYRVHCDPLQDEGWGGELQSRSISMSKTATPQSSAPKTPEPRF